MKVTLKLISAVSLIFVLLLAQGSCRRTENDSTTADIDAVFEKYNMKTGPGCAVAVIHHGEVVHSKGYGMANLEYDIRITPSTVFDIASVSKQFAGLAISTLIEEGKIALDDDIRKYLPEVPDLGKVITIRHLVHHTSGLRDWPQTLNVAGWRWDEVFSFQDIMRMVKNQKELDFEPGEKHSYSNTGYNLLAAIVAKVSGKTFREWTDENIFTPLQMSSSHFLDDHSTVIKNPAYSYYPSGDEFRKSVTALTAYGSSSLFTTLEDLSRWVIHFDKQIASKNPVYTRMLEDGTLNDGNKVGYAFGLSLGKEGKLNTISHTGGWAGYRTAIVNFPDENFSCILLSNAADFNPYGNALEVAKLFLKDKLKTEESKTDDVKDMPTVKVNTVFAKKCTGMYQLGEGWYVTITLENDQLMTQANGEDKFPMAAKSDSVYWVDDYGASMTFKKNKEGDVNSLRYRWVDDAKRITPLPVNTAQFRTYTGTYYSEELAAQYKVDLTDAKLMIHHMRLGDFDLQPDPITEDLFTCRIGVIRFVKDQQKKVTGFKLSGGRVKNIHFDKKLNVN
jgi:CubicO group peptidase (beta-lactamase class C family)